MTRCVAGFVVDTETQCCANCAHFHQHYIRDSWHSRPGMNVFIEILHGHCDSPRLKSRQIMDVCDRFACRFSNTEEI